MDIQDFTLRHAVERIIEKGGDPNDKDLAQLLRDDDLSPVIREYMARRLEGKQKQASRKPDTASVRMGKLARALVAVDEVVELEAKSGNDIKLAEAIDRVAAQKIPGLSRSQLYKQFKLLK